VASERRLGPVERELVVTEAPIRPQLEAGERLAEIVEVELEEIRQQRGVARGRHLENDLLPIYHAAGTHGTIQPLAGSTPPGAAAASLTM